jgi:hypothetical protein
MEKVKYLLNILLIVVSICSTNAQFRTVTGNVSSVPSNASVYAQVIFTNINPSYNRTVYTDSVTGNYSVFIPAGTYKQEINVLNHYRYLDSNFVVTVNRTDSIEIVEYFNTQSLIHTNGMFLIRILTGNEPGAPNTIYKPWKLHDRPIKIFADSINAPNQEWRDSYEFAVNDITTKYDLPELYLETSAAPEIGIQVHWVDQTPTPGLLGETVISSLYPDFSPKKVEIYINKNFPANNNVMLREIERALIFQSDALDQQMIMYYGAPTAGQLHPGEGEVGKRTYRFQHIPKEMTPYDSVLVTSITSIKEENILPEKFVLLQNYPNPFNPNTKISWQSPVGGWQTLKVFDILGNEVVTLVNEYKPVGSYEVEFNAASLTSGIYFYRLQAGEFVATKKMLLMK